MSAIANHVVCTCYEADFRCELSHVAVVAAMTGCPWIHDHAEGEGEGFVIHVQGDPPALQHEAEMAEDGHTGKKLCIKS